MQLVIETWSGYKKHYNNSFICQIIVKTNYYLFIIKGAGGGAGMGCSFMLF